VVQRHDLCNSNGKRMTLITLQDGKPILKDGKIGTEQACCCGEEEGNCQDCDLICCMIIEARNLCEPGTTVQDGGGAGETWGISPATGFFGQTVYQWFLVEVENEFELAFYIFVELSACNVDGTYDAQVFSGSFRSDEDGGIEHQYLNAKAILDEDGCLSGIRLNERDVVCEPEDGCGTTTPKLPDISFICE
jgi:hypothetical protein